MTRTTSGGRFGVRLGRRDDEARDDERPEDERPEDGREDERDRDPDLPVPDGERGLAPVAARAGEDVRVAMSGEPTAQCHTSHRCHTLRR
jgi:hypothetical protein